MNLTAYARTYAAPRLRQRVSAQVSDEHVFASFSDMARVGIHCLCGWKAEFTYQQLMRYASDNEMCELIDDALQEHVDAVVRYCSPTLADMTDWGWFSPEAP